eukprot:CAMPEP_0119523368 /NCGR_PEP_ID=MMETSP1344-20130328/38450_1 /TAXON_ID=236787 /ORGANISM="Florenciella parvula, Strain CCMP2471" /LENGTH=63 /DNA_ID=CAMNT_0007561573 /DNA_START=234 /DNA_END=422 /DNA_ORIENTATION=+
MSSPASQLESTLFTLACGVVLTLMVQGAWERLRSANDRDGEAGDSDGGDGGGGDVPALGGGNW